LAIKGVHAMFYTPEADALRAFLRDKVGIDHFDAGEGWLIFTPTEGEIGCHPSDKTFQDISIYCDDIHATVEEMKAKGVEFIREIEDHGYGFVTYFKAPGGFEIQLYQAKYK
jgi:predicted enzyme related to lactoylglutathione lyase